MSVVVLFGIYMSITDSVALTMQDKDGRLPLHWCTNNKDPKTIEILLDKVLAS